MNSYANYESWKQWEPTDFGRWSALEAAYFSAELRRTAITISKNSRIYEVGYGNGTFAGYVQSLGLQYVGSEINQELIVRARQFGLNVFENGIEQVIESLGLDTFDAVFAFDVLEHLDVDNIKHFLLKARILLKEGGVIFARVPSGDSPFGRVIFHGDITHKTALGSSAVRQLAAQTGFEVIDIGSPKLPVLRVGVVRALRRCGVRCAQSVVAKLINMIFHDGQPRVITPNLVFILKKPLDIAPA